jgi:hypothetical protein
MHGMCAISLTERLESRLLLAHGRFVLANKWPQPLGTGSPVSLTYSYSNLLNGGMNDGLSNAQLKAAIVEALQLWSAVAPLQFTEMADLGTDLPDPADTAYTEGNHARLRFGHHAIDGAGGTLAHGFFPETPATGLAGDVHFDSAENWATAPAPGAIDLLEVAAHQAGHIIGLNDENGVDAIMNSDYHGRFNGPGSGFLLADDISGAQAQYGAGLGYVLDLNRTLYISGTDADNTFTLNVANGTITASSAGVGAFTLPAAGVSAIVINARGGNDTVNIESSTIPVTVNGGAGNDVFNIGSSAHTVSAITSPVTINGDAGADSFNFDDQGFVTGGGGYTITDNLVQRDGPAGRTNYATIESVVINTTETTDSIVAFSTLVGTSVLIHCNGGGDELTTGNWNTMIRGDLTFDGGDGFDGLAINDGVNNANDAYNVSATQVTKNSSAVTIGYPGVDDVMLDASQGNNLFTVVGAPSHSMTLQGNGGVDTFDIVRGDPASVVNVVSGDGLDHVSVNSGATGVANVRFPLGETLGSLDIFDGGSCSMDSVFHRLLQTNTLNISAGGKLDLQKSDLLLDYSGASPLATVQSLINLARHGGAWDGNGITSSFARNNALHNTTLGAMEASDYAVVHGGAYNNVIPDATAVLVKYTYYGDTDFNGRVNFDDYVRADAGFNGHRSGWVNGDFDLNGIVNFDDYVLIDLAFNTQSGVL